jgi:uncharacterized protein (TIRG00374 family)
MKKYLLPAIQGFMTIYILAKIFGDVSLREQASTVIRQADWRWIAAAAGAAAVSELLCATRWWLVLRAFEMPLRWREAVAFSAIGLFYSLGLPGSAGGDAMRTLYVMERFPGRKLVAAFSVLADRLCGLAALLLAMGITLAFQHGILLSGKIGAGIVLASILLLGGALFLLALWGTTAIPSIRAFAKKRLPKLGSRLLQSGDIFTQMLRHPGAMLAGTILSILALAAHFLCYFLSARAFETGITLTQIFTVMPVIDTLTMVPIALYGLGLREALFAFLLGDFYNIPNATATLLSLGGFTAQVLIALSGILFLPYIRLLHFKKASELHIS